MNDTKNKPVQIVLTYNTNASEKDNLRAKVVTTTTTGETAKKLVKLDDNHKLVRRYSFDDNGGGYLGL